MPGAGAVRGTERAAAVSVQSVDERETEAMNSQETNEINREHPDYRARRETWRTYADLYAGGEQMRAHADRYLVPRQKEPRDVYAERLLRVFYENHAGSIVDWYSATLFRTEPVLSFTGGFESGTKFFSEFVENCDLKGTTLADFYRARLRETLIYGKSHILVDFPRMERAVETRAEEDAGGASRAYLAGYSPEELINWSVDEHGNYEWVVLRSTYLTKPKVEDRKWLEATRWVYYDRTSFRVYERTKPAGHGGLEGWDESDDGKHIELKANGFHGLAKLGLVPLFDLSVPEGMWMMNRAGSLQLEHFNKSNALSWALTMGLFAMPVIYSERDWNQMVGESYYIQLGPQDKFGWTEPQGNVYQIAADNLERLRDEIYRVCWLTQGGGQLKGGPRQSGLSKQWEFTITQEVLRAYGDGVKESIKRVLRAIEGAREDNVTVSVMGLDEFEIGDFGTELADAQQLLAMGIESPTLKKQIFKSLAFKYLSDASQQTKELVAREIDEV